MSSLPSRRYLKKQEERLSKYGLKIMFNFGPAYKFWRADHKFCTEFLSKTFQAVTNIYQITLDMFSGDPIRLQVKFTY